MDAPEFLQSPLLATAGFRHAFFARGGGLSSGAFASLNFSASVGDSVENVRGNFERAGQLLGIDAERICHLNQVHGRTCIRLFHNSGRAYAEKLEGDALVSDSSQVACGVRTADCVPILVADVASGAVAAIHAGWRGVAAGVVESALLALKQLGSGRPQLLAATGPHISLAAFEISEDVALELEKASPRAQGIDRTSWPQPHADLRSIVREQLIAGGVSEVDDVLGCTFLEPERFFSFRRSGDQAGRHLAAIIAQERA